MVTVRPWWPIVDGGRLSRAAARLGQQLVYGDSLSIAESIAAAGQWGPLVHGDSSSMVTVRQWGPLVHGNSSSMVIAC